MVDRLQQHLVKIEKELGGSGSIPGLEVQDQLDWHLNKIEDLLEGGVGGNVDDVKVNGESVLEDKVANINLKTINGESISGEGNVAITTYQPFNDSWPTSSTTKAFCDAINVDSDAVIGMAYLGGASFSDLPFTGNGDIVVEILQGPSNGKTIHLILTSGNVAPYHWEYTYWNNGSNVSDWINLTFEGEVIAAPSPNSMSGTRLYPNAMPDKRGTYKLRFRHPTHGDENGLIGIINVNPLTNGWSFIGYYDKNFGASYNITQQEFFVGYLASNNTAGVALSDCSIVEANPTLEGTETELTGLRVKGTKYKVVTSSNVADAINTAIYGAIDNNY